jgi:hypothetical protein
MTNSDAYNLEFIRGYMEMTTKIRVSYLLLIALKKPDQIH